MLRRLRKGECLSLREGVTVADLLRSGDAVPRVISGEHAVDDALRAAGKGKGRALDASGAGQGSATEDDW